MIRIILILMIPFVCQGLILSQTADTIRTEVFSSGAGKSAGIKKKDFTLNSLLGEGITGITSSDSEMVRGGFFYISNSYKKAVSKISANTISSIGRLEISGEGEDKSVLIKCKFNHGIENYSVMIERKSGEGQFEVLSADSYEKVDSTENYLVIRQHKLTPGIYSYRFFISGENGVRLYSGELDITIDKSVENLSLAQNYPNPFNSNTILAFSLPEKMFAKIVVYNLLGEKIATLTEDYYKEGQHEIQYNAFNLTSGMYFYSLEANSISSAKTYRIVKRMLYIK